ncbi:hypothetical protein CMV_025974, partial [Castanea mollissima]
SNWWVMRTRTRTLELLWYKSLASSVFSSPYYISVHKSFLEAARVLEVAKFCDSLLFRLYSLFVV